jgi:hypothetical protein
MRFVTLFIILATALTSAPSLSQDDDDAWGVEFQSFLLGTYSVRTAGKPPPGPEGRTFLLGEERLRLDLTLWSDAVEAEGRLVLDGLHDAVSGEFDFDLREAYLDYSAGDLDFRLGRQIATWGVGDLLFINDIFPKDWVSFFSGRPLEYLKLGVDSGRMRYSSAALNIELMVIPGFRPDTLPTPRRFFLYDGFADIADRTRFLPDTGAGNPEWALRLYRSIAGFDVSAYAYRGYWRSPGQQLDDLNMPTRVAQFYPALSVYGLSAQGQAMGGVLSLEGGYYESLDDTRGDDPAIANSEARFLLGYQKQLSEDFTFGLQYYAEIMQDFDRYRQALTAGIAPRKQYRDIVTLRLTRFLRHQTWTLSLFTFYSPQEQDYLLQPLMSYKVSDNFSTALGANWFGGVKRTTFFGQFDRNDNVHLTLRYDF